MRGNHLVLRGLCAALAVAAALPSRAGEPYLTDDPDPVGYGHWEAYIFTTGTFLRGGASGTATSVEVNAGPFPQTELHVLVPFDYSTEGQGVDFGIGDTELGVKYRFLPAGARDWWPEMAIYPTVLLPTGNASRGLGTGRVHAFFPLWLQKSWGKWVVDTGGGWWVNPGPGNRNYSFMGLAVQRRVLPRWTLGAEIYHQTRSEVAGSPVLGSVAPFTFLPGMADLTGFSTGSQYDLSARVHLLASAGRALADAARTDEFTFYAGLWLSF